jgi:hypothetical protein
MRGEEKLNCFFKSCINLIANIFCHLPLSDFVFLLEILDPLCRSLEGELFVFSLHVEQPTSLLSFSNVNKGRKEKK